MFLFFVANSAKNEPILQGVLFFLGKPYILMEKDFMFIFRKRISGFYELLYKTDKGFAEDPNLT